MKASESAALFYAKMHRTSALDNVLLNMSEEEKTYLTPHSELALCDFATHGIDCLYRAGQLCTAVDRHGLPPVEVSLEFNQGTAYVITGDGKDLCLMAGRDNCCWLCDLPRSQWLSCMHLNATVTLKTVCDIHKDFIGCTTSICKASVACMFDQALFKMVKGCGDTGLRVGQLSTLLRRADDLLHPSSPWAIQAGHWLSVLQTAVADTVELKATPAILEKHVQEGMERAPWLDRGSRAPLFSLAMLDRIRAACKAKFHHVVREPLCFRTLRDFPSGPSGVPTLAVPFMHAVARNGKICLQLVVSQDLHREDASARQCRAELIEVQEALVRSGTDLAAESDSAAAHSTFMNCTKIRIFINHAQEKLADKAGHRGLQLLRFAELLSCILYAPVVDVPDSFCLAYFLYSGVHWALLRLWQCILDFRGRTIATLGSATTTGNLHIHSMLSCGPKLIHSLRIPPSTLSEENGEYSIVGLRKFWRHRSGRDFHAESWQACHVSGRVLDMLMMGSYGSNTPGKKESPSLFKPTVLSSCAIYTCITEQHIDVSYSWKSHLSLLSSLPYHSDNIFVFESFDAELARLRTKWWTVDATPQSAGHLPGWGGRQAYVAAVVQAKHFIRFGRADDDETVLPNPPYPYSCKCNGCLPSVRPSRAATQELRSDLAQSDRDSCICERGPVFLFVSSECSDSDWEMVRWCKPAEPVPTSPLVEPAEDNYKIPHPM